jgi:hypothetical protein
VQRQTMVTPRILGKCHVNQLRLDRCVRSSAVSFVDMDLWTQDARALPPDNIRSFSTESVSISGIIGRSALIHVFVR